MTDIILFGVTGDLSRRRLIPALARAWKEGGISHDSHFVGFGRKKFSKKEFRDFVLEYGKNEDFASRWKYVESELDDIKGYKTLESILNKKAVIYVSLPPQHQLTVFGSLCKAGILKKGNGKVLAIEKPFGADSSSAKKLNNFLLSKISENEIYRIDHYAGKEELMNIEQAGKLGVLSYMNSKSVKAVEITFSEKGTVEGRGAFYDHVGALNDVCQNHMLHMLGTVLAAPYADLPSYASVRAAALKFLKVEKKPLLGQYESFRKEQGVNPQSKTETCFKTENRILFPAKGLSAIEKELKKRWQGLHVSFFGGKALAEDVVSICFHGMAKTSVTPEGTSTCIVTSRHGSKDAYQTIFEAILKGDMSRSIGIGQIVAGWKYIESVKAMKPVLKIYKDHTNPFA